MENKIKKIILLNPPADKIFIRDYYCTFSSKADYYWPPQDLIVLSGILSENYEITVMDAIGHKISFENCYEQILSKDFDAIIFSTGSATLENDIEFIGTLKKDKKFKAIASSAIFAFAGTELMNRFKAIDAGVIDFSDSEIISYLQGDFKNIKGMIYRDTPGIVKTNSNSESNIRFPLPQHQLFLNHKNTFLLCQRPFAVVISSIGCPFKCRFCIAGQINFRLRELDNLLEELRYIKNLGINDIFFADPTFTADKNYSIELCKAIVNLKFRWICNSHPRQLLDDKFVTLLRRAGCHTIMIGVESGDENILQRFSKGVNLCEIKRAFEICRENDISTLAYFIIGLPGENKSSILKTINFSKRLGCDFVSFDFATPDFGTELREELIKNNLISSDLLVGWDPSKKPLYSIDNLSIRDIIKLRNKAYREFYLRPSYIGKRLFNLNSSEELKDLLKGGISLFLRK